LLAVVDINDKAGENERENKAEENNGFLVFWFSGFLVFWFSGFLVFWFSGFLVFWFSGFLVSKMSPGNFISIQ
jgi:uncharacterized membrane protein